MKNVMEHLDGSLANLKRWTARSFKRIWDLYVLYLDWSVFSTVGADSMPAYACAAVMTLAFLLVLLLGIIAIAAIAYAVVSTAFKSAAVFLAFAALAAVIAVAVNAAAKSWKKKNA